MSIPERELVSRLRDAVVQAGPACTTADAELFTGPDVFEPERPGVRRYRENVAKNVCRSCPARSECLAYALAIRPREGVWAGFTSREIRVLSLAQADEQEAA